MRALWQWVRDHVLHRVGYAVARIFDRRRKECGPRLNSWWHSLPYRIAVGPHQGRKAFCLQSLPPAGSLEETSARVAKVAGFSLHAEEPLRVRFIGFGGHSLDIEIHCYIETTNINNFKGVIEGLNLRMMEIINRAGTRIAMPAAIEYEGQLTQPEYMADHRLEEISSELSEEEIASIRNTISYPAGSN